MDYHKAYSTLEEGIESLKDIVKLRDNMGGAMYWNMINDECCQLASKLRAEGADYAELAEILGAGNFH